LYSVACAAACPRTNATAALAGATGRGAARLETTLPIVSAEGISFAGNWRGFPTLRVPECKSNETDDCKNCEDDEHYDAVYESARLPSTCAIARATASSHNPCNPFSQPRCPQTADAHNPALKPGPGKNAWIHSN